MQVNLFACRLNVKQPNLNNNKLLEHFKTFAIFDRNTGTYGCEIELLTSLNSIVDSIKSADISLELQVIFHIQFAFYLLLLSQLMFDNKNKANNGIFD
jgi:hypothetical protein